MCVFVDLSVEDSGPVVKAFGDRANGARPIQVLEQNSGRRNDDGGD